MKFFLNTLLLSAITLSASAESKSISTRKAPSAIGHYSQAMLSNGFLWISGQIPINPATNQLENFNGDIQKQTDLVLSNIKAILDAAGCTKTDILKTTVLLSDIQHFNAMNASYAEFFGSHKPARSTFQATLPKGAQVEIEAVAACPQK